MSNAASPPPGEERSLLQQMSDSVPPSIVETPAVEVAPEIVVKKEKASPKKYPPGRGEEGPTTTVNIRHIRHSRLPFQRANGEPFPGSSGAARTSPQSQVQAMDVDVGQVGSVGHELPVSSSGLDGSASEAWQVGKSFAESMEYLLNNDVGTRKDVTFIVGPEKEEIPTHKLFLALASPEFDYMLYDSPLVRNITKPLYVVLRDVSPNAFRMMLKFIYIKHVDIPMEDAMELLKVAYRFALPDLVARCRCVIRTGITDANSAEILEEAVTSFPDEGSLREYALAHIFSHGKQVLQTPGFLKLSRDSLCAVLESDELIINEFYVFQAAIRWAEQSIRNKEQNADLKISDGDIRNELGEALFLIRFPLMKAQEFKAHVGSRHILTDKEKLDICYTFITKGDDDENQSELLPFSQVKRAHRTTLAEATSSTESELATADEPLRKRLKTELEVEVMPEPEPVVAMLEPIASSSGWNSPIPRERTLSEESDHAAVKSDDDSMSASGISNNDANEVDAEARGPSIRTRSLQNLQKNMPAMTEEEDTYLKDNSDSITGNNLYNLFQRMLQTLDINSEDVKEIREEQPVVINTTNLFPLHFPNLTEFHINYLKNFQTIERLREYLKNLNLGSLIFYKIFEDQDFQDLWLRNVNTTLVVNGVTILKMDCENKALTLCRIKQANSILKGVALDPTMRTVHIDDCDIESLDLIPTQSLESLTLRRVKGIKNRVSFLKKCKNLQEFSCPDMSDENLDLGNHLRFFENVTEGTKLRRLALGKVKLSCSKPVTKLNNKVEELYLDNCQWNLELFDSIPLIFPNLKKIKICRGKAFKPKWINSLMEIESMEYMCFWEISFKISGMRTPRKGGRGKMVAPTLACLENQQMISDLKDFLESAGLEINQSSNTFILEKLPVAGSPLSQLPQDQVIEKSWRATKFTSTNKYDYFTQMDYEQFDWSMFYKDYSVFYKINL